MNRTLYEFNSSQDIINLQTKYTLFKRVANILFSVTFDEKVDWSLMKKTINILIERNDCLRIVFVKKDGKNMQYFAESKTIEKIPYKEFDTVSKMTSFINCFRKKMADIYKGETIIPVFAKNPAGKDMLIIKVSHFVADTFAIGLLVDDLCAIYKALKNGTEMPAPKGKFEDVLKKDIEFKNNPEAVEKDREFFKEYFSTMHPERPIYCGLHGDNNDRWLAQKRKGNISLPYAFIKCDTEGYKFTIPAAITEKVEAWCAATQFPISSFFYYCYSVAASLINGKAPYQCPLELLNCRATMAERKCGGTKVQSIAVYTTVDYNKSFNQNVKELFEERQQICRHTRLTYLENEKFQHDNWNYSMLSQITSFCYSFIPMADPEGVKVQVLSNGKGALIDYVAFMYDINTKEINVMHDIQYRQVTPQQLVDFHNLLTRVIETVLANPETELGRLF